MNKTTTNSTKRSISKKFWISLIRRYCESTSLHGFNYIVSRDSTTVEKIVWLAVCLLGLSFSVLLMLLVWQRFTQTPTVITVETMTHPIFSLNFPAVSICNNNKVYKPHAEKLSKIMRKKGLNEIEISNFMLSLPKLVRPDYTNIDNKRSLDLITSANFTIDDIMYEVMQPCEKLLLRCEWESIIYDCNKIFKPIRTKYGFCCAFNYHVDTSRNSLFRVNAASKRMLNASSAAKKYMNENEPGVSEVLTVHGAGQDMGLSLILDFEKDAYVGSVRPIVGASILIHDPFHYPEIEMISRVVQMSQETSVILAGTIMESAPNVRQLDVRRRNCWFDDERNLTISPVYSYPSCITECRIRYIKKFCKCVPFYYPNYLPGRVCSLSDINCLRKYQDHLSNLRSMIDIAAEKNELNSSECECLPSCDDYFYTSNIENAYMEDIPFHSMLLEGFNVNNVSLAYVYFDGITCLKYRKESWKSWDDVLASFGGIFGLCVGGSVVSLVELFYYCTIKLIRSSNHERHPAASSIQYRRDKFKIANIENLNKWTIEEKGSNKTRKRNIQMNFESIKTVHLTKPRLHEYFIKHFLQAK